MPDDTLPWAVQNQSRCHLGSGLGCAQGSMCYMGVHIGANSRIRLNRLCAAAMLPFVKLLWSLVAVIIIINEYY